MVKYLKLRILSKKRYTCYLLDITQANCPKNDVLDNGRTDITWGTWSTSTISSGYNKAMQNCTNHSNIAIKYEHTSLQLCEIISLNTILFRKKIGRVRIKAEIWFFMDILHIDYERYLLEKMDLNFGRNLGRHGYYTLWSSFRDNHRKKHHVCYI